MYMSTYKIDIYTQRYVYSIGSIIYGCGNIRNIYLYLSTYIHTHTHTNTTYIYGWVDK